VTETEIRQLLAAAMAYDNRRPAKAAVLAWTEASVRAGWTFDAALDALHAHYAESTAFLMPGHITERLRSRRDTDMPPPYQPALLAAAPADETTRNRIMTMVGDRFSLRTRRERRPTRRSAEHIRAREAARVELSRVAARRQAPP
jgi:hypothetical protein